MDIQHNPRPNHRLTRCCTNCKFFLRERVDYVCGFCILPEGPKLSNNPARDLKSRIHEFAKTHVTCVCDNHQWKDPSKLKRAVKWAKVSINVIK